MVFYALVWILPSHRNILPLNYNSSQDWLELLQKLANAFSCSRK